jgi:hippurate hydrolase
MTTRTGLVAGLFAALVSQAGGFARAEAPAKGGATPPMPAQVIAVDYPRLRALYEDIHQHPELGFQERRTAGRLAAELRGLGFEVAEGVGGTGLVALYRNGPGPVVMVRTELDALPMEEKTGLAYASRATATWDGAKTFVAHSCGHDVHMTVWAGVAKALLARKDQWRGTLMFVAQPDEEGDRGAKAMLADGLFTRFPRPDYALALHVAAMAYGTFGYRPGPTMAASDTVEVTFHGKGGHGAAPQTAIDPIVIAARFIVDLQTIVSREKDPNEFGVATIGAIQGGTVGNIIPDDVTVRGTLRSYQPSVREALVRGVRRTAEASAQMAGAPAPEVKILDAVAPLINDVTLTTRLAAVLSASFPDRVSVIPPIAGSEDFSEYGAAGVASFYYVVGGLDPAQVSAAAKAGTPLPGNHSPLFAPVPEPTITAGVQSMTLLVLDLLHR